MVAGVRPWPLYCDAMTDPNEKPSFLARLAVVATIGIVVLQIGLDVAVITDAKRGMNVDALDWILTVLFPAVSFFVVACLYYLFKGKPSNADEIIASRLYRVWGMLVIGGAICSAVLIYAAKVSFSNQFRF